MAKTTFLIGGARSGKSRYAEELAKKKAEKVAYLATSQIIDEEWEKRVQVHRKRRPASWKTYELEKSEVTLQDFTALLEQIVRDGNELVLVDCVTLLIFRIMQKYDVSGLEVIDNRLEQDIERDVLSFFEGFIDKVRKTDLKFVIVSNEVGLGIVPAFPLGRVFRDLIGMVNMKIADLSDEVVFFVAGIGQKIKGL